MTNHISEGSFQAPHVDAQLQRGGSANRHQRIVVLHLLLGALAVRSRQVTVVDEETVGLVLDLAVLPQLLAYGFALLPRVGEYQALLAPRMLKDVV